MKTLILASLLAGSFGTMLPDAHAYTQPASVVDSGGGVSSSAGYENLGAIGQPIIGLATGAGGSNHAGFIPVLGAHGVLWPVIGFDPANFTFTFYIGEPAPAGQGLNLTNAGGSTLEWTVARTQAWLTLTPLAGTGPSPVTVGINIGAPGLVPGVYHDTITISATGAENDGVTIPVTLTVGRTTPSPSPLPLPPPRRAEGPSPSTRRRRWVAPPAPAIPARGASTPAPWSPSPPTGTAIPSSTPGPAPAPAGRAA